MQDIVRSPVAAANGAVRSHLVPRSGLTRRNAIGAMFGIALADAIPNKLGMPYLAASVGDRMKDHVTLREFGVYGDASDEHAAIQSAIDEITNDAYFSRRSITLSGDPYAVYNFSDDILIRRPHFTLDMQGARVVANSRFTFRGNLDDEPGAMEIDDLLLDDVHFKNARFGNPKNFDQVTRGPIMTFVRNSSMQNLKKIGRGGTSFNLHFARNSKLVNIENHGAREIGMGETIGILLWHTYRCEVRDFAVSGPGQWAYCVQQKGGVGNRWVNGNIHDVQYANPKGCIFRDRGDSPYDRSMSAAPYPYLTRNWNEPDLRRASHDTEWIGLTAKNTPDTMPCFATQESRRSRLINFTGSVAKIGGSQR